MTVKWKTVEKDDSLGANTKPAANILKHKPGSCGVIRRIWSTLDAFELYFTDEMLEKIVTYANTSTDYFRAEYPEVFTKDDKKDAHEKRGHC